MNAVAPAPKCRVKDAGHGDEDVLPPKHECIKMLKELNRESARYHNLLLGLGGPQDSSSLRSELTRVRHKAFDTATQCRDLFLPHIRSKEKSNKDKSATCDMERLWNCYLSCLDLLEEKLKKTLHLQLSFPFYLGQEQAVLINTGVTESGISTKSASLSMEHLDITAADKRNGEKEEFRMLEKDIDSLQSMVTELIEISALHPWAIEPEIDVSRFECSKSLHSMSDTSSIEENTSIQGSERYRRRKYMCIAACILISLVVFATVLGLCIAFI